MSCNSAIVWDDGYLQIYDLGTFSSNQFLTQNVVMSPLKLMQLSLKSIIFMEFLSA